MPICKFNFSQKMYVTKNLGESVVHQEAKEEFSIVIPVIEGSDDIEALLKCENQIHIPSEIIIVESKTKDLIFLKKLLIIHTFTNQIYCPLE